ncbi:MAG: hypothetical protein MK209_00875, partial [Planctomycetes bacterium]|nr:hypothetical protein [Planctomycetota bacterium]
SGLLLLPWILLYGVTALLFNHAGWLSERTVEHIPSSELHAVEVDEVAKDPSLIAEAVVESLREHHAEAFTFGAPHSAKFLGSRSYRIIDPDPEATVVYESISKSEAAEVPRRWTRTIVVDPASKGGKIYATPVSDSPESAGFSVNSDLQVGLGLKAAWEDQASAWVESRGWDAGELEIRRFPSVEFELDVDGEAWLCTYGTQRGSLSARPVGISSSTEPLRRFALRLHKAYGYSNSNASRAIWALFVDLTGFLMAFWGLSGILMWVQMRRLRTAGLVCLIISLGVAAGLGWAMWTEIG